MDGKPYELSFLCKPNGLRGPQIRGAVWRERRAGSCSLDGKDDGRVFFGSPSRAEQDAKANTGK